MPTVTTVAETRVAAHLARRRRRRRGPRPTTAVTEVLMWTRDGFDQGILALAAQHMNPPNHHAGRCRVGAEEALLLHCIKGLPPKVATVYIRETERNYVPIGSRS